MCGQTTEMSKWKDMVGGSDLDYIRHLEAALRCACTRLTKFPPLFEEDFWFSFLLYFADHEKHIEI